MLAALSPPAGGIVHDWLNDPQAITMLLIAVVGGGFALYRFRFIPRERKRETLKAMQDSYGASLADRAVILQSFPPYLLLGREAVEGAVAAAGPVRSDLIAQFKSWKSLTSTAAHEVTDSEAKFRSLLWVVQGLAPVLRGPAPGATEQDGVLVEQIETAQRLVGKLNNFSQMVELNLFPQDDVLGQLHRSIASACKAVEPLIWCQNALGGRWGLRVSRLLLRAEHFNEVHRIHRMNSLVWRRQDGDDVLIQPALYRSDFGRAIATERLREMSVWDRLVLGWAAFRVRIWPRYGGVRLRRHVDAENELIGQLKFAYDANWDALDVEGWDKTRLEEGLARHWASRLEPEPAGAA